MKSDRVARGDGDFESVNCDKTPKGLLNKITERPLSEADRIFRVSGFCLRFRVTSSVNGFLLWPAARVWGSPVSRSLHRFDLAALAQNF